MIGLTGGIGSGKSVVAARLAQLGAVIIDSDQLAREVVAPGTDGLAAIVSAFGEGVLAADGSLDRAAVARLVFHDAKARRRLEKIIHPRVRRRTEQIVAEAPPEAVVVNDVPLLIEANLTSRFDLVIAVLADAETRAARLVRDRGMAEEDVRARMASQATDDQRRAVADVIIVNDGSRVALRKAVTEVWRQIAPDVADRTPRATVKTADTSNAGRVAPAGRRSSAVRQTATSGRKVAARRTTRAARDGR